MKIDREKLNEIYRSLKECRGHAHTYAGALPLDGRDRRQAEEDITRASEVLVEIQDMLSQRDT
jgi:hypothetical protein